MIKAFIFDLDGTLVNTEKLHYRAWNETLQQNGIENISFESFLSFAGTSNERVAADFIQSHLIKKSISELVLEKQTLYMELIPDVTICDGVYEIINAFKGKVTMAVASSSHKKEVHAILKAHDLIDLFSQIVGGDMVTRQKPDPEIYLTTIKLLGVKPHNSIAFEDSTHGLQAAKNAGLHGIAIPNEFTMAQDFSRADLVLNSLKEFNEEVLQRISPDGTSTILTEDSSKSP